MLIRMVRTKVVAVLLGPTGVGLEALFDSIVSFARTIVDLGISSSGVRQVAASVGSGRADEVAKTIYTLRRTSRVLGVLGALTLFMCREAVSRFTFGNADQSRNVGILSLILLFGAITGGQGALLQGLRRIGDLARINIIGTLIGAAVSIPIIAVWGTAGIPYYMVLGAAAGAVISWFYARRVQIQSFACSAREVFREAAGLLRLGMAFLASALMATGALFLLRVLAVRTEGAEGAGQFQAASALSMVYVGFILQAMGTDFYPRLTAVASDNPKCNQLVNEQTEVSLLLALPGILATIAFAPWVVWLFYSNRFSAAAEILCWQMAGNFLRVVSWPMGFILLAKGRGVLFVLTDALAWTMYVILAWFGLRWVGLPGMGMAFFGLYLFHVVMIALVVAWCSEFKWSAINQRLLLLGVVFVGLSLAARLLLVEPWATLVGLVLASVSCIISVKLLIKVLGAEQINRWLQKLRLPFKLA